MAINTEQAGTIFAQMTPEQVRQYLTQKMVNIGPLQPIDAPMGSADGVRREDMTPTYGNANVQGLQADGQGGYWGPVTPPFDTQLEGGKYGQYFARFDAQGNLQPDSIQFSPVERDSGWLSNHLPEVVGTILVAAGGAAAAEFAGLGGGAPGAGGLASADTGMLGFSGSTAGGVAPVATTAGAAAAPIVQAGPMTLGAGATVSDIAAAAAAGTPISQLAPAITNLVKTAGPSVLQALKAIPGLSGIVDQVAGVITGGDGMLNNLLNIGAGATQLAGLKDASNTAAQGYQDLGDSLKGQYQFLGDKGQGMFDALGAKGQAGYENLGMKVGETYNDLADTYQQGYGMLGDKVGNTYNNLATQTEGQYAGLAARTKADVGKFTPFNITTNVGSTDGAGKFTPTSGSQGISDAATQAATSSFGAANNIDVNNLAKQRYDLMQQVFAPGDQQSLAAIQAQQQARGRTGLQSLNPATSIGGVGANPAMVAYYKALEDRNLKAQATAADQALAQRGGLLSQGASAAAVPLNIATQGTNQLQLGANIGNLAFDNSMAGAQLGANIESRGLDRGADARMTGANTTANLYRQGLQTGLDTRLRGADQVTGLFGKGLDYNLGQQERGITTNLNLAREGLTASTPQYVRAIGQKYEGNLAATNALFSLLSAIARGSGQRPPSQGGSATDMVGQITNLLKGQGVSDAQIQQIVQSQVDTTNPFTSNSYEDNADVVNSIFG